MGPGPSDCHFAGCIGCEVCEPERELRNQPPRPPADERLPPTADDLFLDGFGDRITGIPEMLSPDAYAQAERLVAEGRLERLRKDEYWPYPQWYRRVKP